MSLIEHYASQEPPPHMCFTTDGEWVACPADLCEAFYLAQENVRLSRQLAGAVGALRALHRTDPARTLQACAEADPSGVLSDAVAPPPKGSSR